MEREELIRLGIFLTLFALLAVWEVFTPRRKRVGVKAVRWFSNFTLVGLNTLLVPVIVPIVALSMANLASERGWGLFNIYELSNGLVFVASIIILDFIIYLQHILFHSVPILWRLHRVHHSDVDLDVTSGSRFHLLEILISAMNGSNIQASSVAGRVYSGQRNDEVNTLERHDIVVFLPSPKACDRG